MSKVSVRFVRLELLRGLAALLVLFEHVELLFGSQLQVPFRNINGALGVDIFFVISGFLMVHVSGDYAAGWMSARNFIVNRISRILPLYWVMTAIYALAFMAAGKFEYVSWEAFVKSLLFIPYGTLNSDGNFPPIVGVGWTLNYEMMFYGIFALVIVVMGRNAAWGCTMIIVSIVTLDIVSIGVGYELLSPYLLIKNPIALEFAMGMLVGLLMRREKLLIGKSASIVIVALVTIYLLAAVIFPMQAGGFKPLLYGLPSAILVYSIVMWDRLTGQPSSQEGKFEKISFYLGKLSYSLYLTHFIGLMVAVVIIQKLFGSAMALTLVVVPVTAVTIILLLLLADGFHRYIEQPSSHWAKRLLSGGKQQAVSA